MEGGVGLRHLGGGSAREQFVGGEAVLLLH